MSIMTEAQASADPESGGPRPGDLGPGDRGPGGRAASASGRPAPEPTYEGDFVLDEHLLLDCGRTLANPTLHYAVYGRLNAARDNAVLVCHALSGSAQVGQWWPELFAPGGLLRLDHDCVLCVNLLGSCYGSTGPGSVDPETGRTYGPDFPLISIRDNVRAQGRLLDSLGIRRLRLVLGGSIGGMQALEWSIVHPDRVERAAIIAVAPLGAMGLALEVIERESHGGERRDADDERALNPIWIEDGPIEGLHAADGAAEDETEFANAERVKQEGLGADVVADGNEGKVGAVGVAGFRVDRLRPGGAVTGADEVDTDDEVVLE